MRKSRRNKAEQPAEPTAAAPASSPTEAALLARLEALEAAQKPDAAWHPLDRYRIEHERWVKAHTRVAAEDPCPACGKADGGEQRRTGDVAVLPTAWLCVDCTEAVSPGWGTQHALRPARSACLDRLAALAAGMDEPTPGFSVLSGRYGLRFSLAQDTPGGDGTAWSHLDPLSEWRSVGDKAVRRAAAGFGVFPATDPSALKEETELRRVYDPSSPAGSRMGFVPVAQEPPTQEETNAQLAAEETAVDVALQRQKREAKEREAQEERKRREAEILAAYREHVAKLETEIQASRQGLHGDLRAALAVHAERGL